MKAILLLAGYATRMYPLTENMPKALLPLKGKCVIDYMIEEINTIPEIDTIYAVTNSRFYQHFADWAKTAPTTIPIEVLDDGTTTNDNRRGAIGDIVFTISEKNIQDDLFVAAGDNYFTFKLQEQYQVFKDTGCTTLAGKEIDDIDQLRAFAVATTDATGKVLSLVEKPEDPPSNLAIYATYFYPKNVVPMFNQYIAEGNNPDAPGQFPGWLHTRQDVYSYTMNGDCYDIGTIEMYDQMNGEDIHGH